jgi:glutathione S-transferase
MSKAMKKITSFFGGGPSLDYVSCDPTKASHQLTEISGLIEVGKIYPIVENLRMSPSPRLKTPIILESVELENLPVDFRSMWTALQFADWPALKATLPFGQIPYFKDDQVEIPQSMAIVRHLGRKNNLYGSSPAEQAQVDVIIDAAGDVGQNCFKLMSTPEFKAGDRKALTEALDKALSEFDKLKPANSPFIVGNQVTIADFVLFNMLDNFIKPLAPEAMKAHTTMETYRQHIASLKNVAAYLASSRRPAITLPPFFGVLCTPEECK